MEDLQKQLEAAGYKGEHDLSSYIDACGEGFRDLELAPRSGSPIWLCNQTADDNCLECIPEGWDEWEATGDTPEEAVARLLLCLLRDKVGDDEQSKEENSEDVSEL